MAPIRLSLVDVSHSAEAELKQESIFCLLRQTDRHIAAAFRQQPPVSRPPSGHRSIVAQPPPPVPAQPPPPIISSPVSARRRFSAPCCSLSQLAVAIKTSQTCRAPPSTPRLWQRRGVA
ncbi:hypothetical protein STAS_08644 [Striga asiatica]|uniref:Uncharacterized protein n=1 Tax=Striga asiatica TaxID=4170 RepID=A0A5A7PIK9_STRAF|nr:hypothetical protein STAS_08644 [Striga asiatica]